MKWFAFFSDRSVHHAKNQQVFLYGLLIWLGLVEMGVFLFPEVFGQLGLWSWLVSWLVVVIAIVRPFAALLRASWRETQFGWLFAIGILVVVWCYQLASPRTVGGESTQEIGCALFLMAKPDAGYQRSCLFGYPTRQYYLPALPSLLFGRSIYTLNIGNSLYVWLGLATFLAAIWQYWRHNSRVWWGLALVVLLLPQLYYFHHFFYFRFEQSIFPFAFGLLGIAWWLLFKSTADQKYLLLLVLWLYQLLFAYTPAMSLLVLGGVNVLVMIWELRPKFDTVSQISWWSMWLSLGGVLLMGVVMTLLNRHDIKLVGTSSGQTDNSWLSLWQALVIFINPFAKKVFFAWPMLVGFWGVLGWWIWKRTWWSLGLAAWVVATVMVSVLVKGYAYYQIDFRLHRAMVMMPVIMIGLVAWLMESKWRLRQWHLWVVTLGLLVSGVWHFYSYARWTEIEKNYVLAIQLRQILNPTAETTKREVLAAVEPHSVYRPINDWLKYFDPSITVHFEVVKADCKLPAKMQYIFLRDIHGCRSVWLEQGWQIKDSWQTLDDWPADLLEKAP